MTSRTSVRSRVAWTVAAVLGASQALFAVAMRSEAEPDPAVTSPEICDSADTDGDGVNDVCDNCPGLANPSQEDFDGFGPQRVISIEASVAKSVFAADVDADGDTDALSASSDAIAWYENLDGAGTFSAARVISTVSFANSVFAADVNGDGYTDVLSASGNDNTIEWYENLDGAGAFGPQQVISTAVVFPTSVFAADVDGDHDMDVLSASAFDNTIAWYENLDGAGGFGVRQVIDSAAIFATSVFAVDVDGDHDIDVLSASYGSLTVAWYENLDGAGSFGPRQVISTDAIGPWSVFAADLDGDHDTDVLSASWADHKVAWYENLDGQGSFGAQQIISTEGRYARSVFAADLDRDGDADVLAACWGANKATFYENLDGAGSFGAEQVISTVVPGVESVFAAEIDRDGRTDALSASVDGKIAWYPNVVDGIGDACDNCRWLLNTDQADADADTIGDACDNCPQAANADQADADADTIGDACDPCPFDATNDVDGDGVCGLGDNCPTVANADQADSDVVWPTFAQWGVSGDASSVFPGSSYATGSPRVWGCADVGWKPLDGGPAVEWLELTYEIPVQATRLWVLEAQLGGFVQDIELRDAGNVLHHVLDVEDKTACGEVLDAKWTPRPEPIVGARVYTSIEGYEAIEGMALEGVAPLSAPDGLGDACDPCPAEFSDSIQTFVQTLLAWDRGSLVWTFPVDVTWVRGELSSLPAYAVTASGGASASTSLDIAADQPSLGTGLWYLVRLAGPCGSWETVPYGEPGRSAALP